MKTKLLLLLFLLAFKLPAFAQNKVVKYCEVTSVETGLSPNNHNAKTIIVMGSIDSLFSFKNPDIKIQLQKVNSIRNRTDLLNYMSYIGWTLIHVQSDQFYFKKEFDPLELATTNNH